MTRCNRTKDKNSLETQTKKTRQRQLQHCVGLSLSKLANPISRT